MVVIESSVRIDASRDKVWEAVADLDNEPEFWKGTVSVRNISKSGNKIEREVTLAFRNKRCMQEVSLEPKEKIFVKFTKGVIIGSKTITLQEDKGGTILNVRWDITMRGVMGVFSGMLKGHIRGGTESSLRAIKASVE